MPRSSFTVLDFIQVFKALYAKDWKRLKERFGQFGEKRRYTVSTYLSNRLDLYSQKSHSLLRPFVRARAELEKLKKPSDKDIKSIKSEIEKLVNQEKGLRKNEGALESKIKEYADVKEKGVCPTCDRPANLEEFTEKIETITAQITKVSQQVNDISASITKKRDLIKKMGELFPQKMKGVNWALHKSLDLE